MTDLIKDNIVLVLDQEEYITIKRIQKAIPENQKVIEQQKFEIEFLNKQIEEQKELLQILFNKQDEVISTSKDLKDAFNIISEIDEAVICSARLNPYSCQDIAEKRRGLYLCFRSIPAKEFIDRYKNEIASLEYQKKNEKFTIKEKNLNSENVSIATFIIFGLMCLIIGFMSSLILQKSKKDEFDKNTYYYRQF
jgi:hypothetical protein